MLNEHFWIFLSFIFLIGISFKIVKRNIISTLDRKIQSVSGSVKDITEMKNITQEQLLSLKTDYTNSLAEYQNIISDAEVAAKKIINDTEEKIKILNERYSQLITEYKQHSHKAMIDSLKGDILMTIFHLIENDQKQDSRAQMSSVSQSINVMMKKIWN